MKRTAIVIAMGALLLAACAGGSSVAATVDGVEITADDVEALLFEVSDRDRTPEQFAVYLGLLIQWEAIDQRVASELDFEPSEEAIDTQVRTVVLGAGDIDIESFLVQQNISESALRRLAIQLLIEEQLHDSFAASADEPTVEEAQQAIEEDPEQWVTEVCASHILLETTDEADATLARLDAGEDFTALAAELSIDPSTAPVGGSLGCADPSGYVPEFAAATAIAPIGEVVGPVESQFGAHLILLESRTTTPVEEVRQALIDERAFEAVTGWLTDAVKMADVIVDETRGTWVTDPSPRLLPPATLG